MTTRARRDGAAVDPRHARGPAQRPLLRVRRDGRGPHPGVATRRTSRTAATARAAIYTAEGDVIAMSEFGGTPLHLGTMHPAVRTVFTSWPAETLEPGDAIIMNTPYPAGPGHLNDVCVVGPIFIDGELFAIAASQSHRVDIGGFAPGSMPFGVTEHFQEGLQITPMKIMRRGVLDEHLLAFINQNVRTPEEQTGDLMAQIAANVIAQRRIEELAGRTARRTCAATSAHSSTTPSGA